MLVEVKGKLVRTPSLKWSDQEADGNLVALDKAIELANNLSGAGAKFARDFEKEVNAGLQRW